MVDVYDIREATSSVFIQVELRDVRTERRMVLKTVVGTLVSCIFELLILMRMRGNCGAVLMNMLFKRRDRSISIVLSSKERECDKYLPKDASQRLRKVILDQFNDLVDFTVDVCNSLDTGDVQLNEVYLRRLTNCMMRW